MYGSVLITGASHGIGRAFALEVAPHVSHLALFAKDKEVENTAAECEALGAKVTFAIGDITDEKTLKKWVRKIDKAQPLDLVFACAGISPVSARAGLIEGYALVEEMVSVNLLGSVATAQAILPRMQARGRGQIALMASIAAFISTGDSPSYCASKSAVLAYGKSLRHRARPHGVGVSIVCPGYVHTRLTEGLNSPQPGIMSADAAARIILSGLRKNKETIIFPKKTYYFARFMSSLPEPIKRRLIDKYQYK